MLTVMCPNCRHRFPAPGCCNPASQSTASRSGGVGVLIQPTDCTSNNGAFYGGGYLLVPREYNNNNNYNNNNTNNNNNNYNNVGGCIINAPTIIHGPTIIQQPGNNRRTVIVDNTTDCQTLYANDDKICKLSNVERQMEIVNCQNIFNNSGNLINVDLSKSVMTNDVDRRSTSMDCQINTTCDLTGGTVTITTPAIQSGGCLIQTTDAGINVRSPRIEIRPKLSGGGCFVQKRLSMDDDDNVRIIYRDDDTTGICLLPPSGCQELPGIRRCSSFTRSNDGTFKRDNRSFHGINEETLIIDDDDCHRHSSHRNNHHEQHHQHQQHQQQQQQHHHHHHHHHHRQFGNSTMESDTKKRHSSCCCGETTMNDDDSRRTNVTNDYSVSSNVPKIVDTKKNNEKNPYNVDASNAMEIRVNATVQLPANVEHCTVNITATTGKKSEIDRMDGTGSTNVGRVRNNFNGGGLIQVDANVGNFGNETVIDRRDDAPTTPVSWLIPCPWQFDNYSQDKEVTRLADIKRQLQTSGWYHEGLSWQQSETLLKNSAVGSWLMRDSSDSRFIFAVSVQTNRGPTSVRVHYFLGRFRLDAEPRLSHNMPSFECPIKMLEHYVDYSNKIDENRKEVWVDYSGQLYSQIYLTKPLVKEVRSLSHLARIVVNKNNINTKHLPPLIKNYLAEYPYSL